MTELGDYSSFEETQVAEQVAEESAIKIFEVEYKHLLSRLERQEQMSSNIIFGAVVATVLVLAGLILSTWLFVHSYSQQFSNIEYNFQTAISELRKENFEFKTELMQLRLVKDK